MCILLVLCAWVFPCSTVYTVEGKKINIYKLFVEHGIWKISLNGIQSKRENGAFLSLAVYMTIYIFASNLYSLYKTVNAVF